MRNTNLLIRGYTLPFSVFYLLIVKYVEIVPVQWMKQFSTQFN